MQKIKQKQLQQFLRNLQKHQTILRDTEIDDEINIDEIKDETKEKDDDILIEEDATDGKQINPRKTRKGKVFSSPEKKSEVFECIHCRKKVKLQQKFKEDMN